MKNTPFPDDSVDAFIADRLPPWMANATVEQLQGLHQALLDQQRAREQVQAVFAQVQPLDEFASPLLEAALESLLHRPVDVRAAKLRRVVHIRYPSGVTTVPDRVVPTTLEQPLLACALHNFDRRETAEVAWLPQSNVLDADGTVLPLRPRAFAGVCRSLDLGAAYQQHLKQVLFADDKRRREVSAVLEEGWRRSLLAAIELARLQGVVKGGALDRLVSAVAGASEPPAGAFSELRLLGRVVTGITVFEPASDQASSAPQDLIVWIPDDPYGAIGTYPSWSQLFRSLGTRLRDPAYRQFFQRFIKEHDRLHFSQRFQHLLASATTGEPLELDARHQVIHGALIAHLRSVQVDTLLEDAQALAVPNTAVDSQARDRRNHVLKGLGLDLLGLASFFVPELGLPLLALAARQITDDVIDGYHEWALGDREAALAHLIAVAQNVVMIGVGAAVGAAAGRMLAREGIIDELAPVLTPTGEQRLARVDLPGYAVPDTHLMAGQRGLLDGRPHVAIEGNAYRLGLDEQRPTIEHPQRGQAPEIILEDNEAGGVRHALERPQAWSNVDMLVARLGSNLGTVSPSAARAVLRSVGLDEAALRRLHLENAPAPARLCDALQRYELHRAFPRLRGPAFEAQWQEAQGVPALAADPLHRDFPGLSTRAGRELLAAASDTELSQLLEQCKVPLALAERARWVLHDARLDRACAGFEQPNAVDSDTERLALALLHLEWPWAASVKIEVHEAQLGGARRASVGADTAPETRCVIHTAQGYLATDHAGRPLPGAVANDGFFQALLRTLDPEQRVAMGGASKAPADLASALADRAFADRTQAARLLGMTPVGKPRPPMRLGDGRIGYVLSGRPEGSRQAMLRGYQQIFPTLSDMEIEVYLERVRLQGEQPWDHLRQLQQCLVDLGDNLAAWRREATTAPLPERRRQIARRIRQCWRRKRPDANGEYRLVIDSERIDSLPLLPEQALFDHVTHLTLRRAHLSSITEGFLQRFPNVRTLDLSHNMLTSVPEGIQTLTQLTELHLTRNQIVIDDAGLARLSALTKLRVLDLSHNPIGQLPPLGRLLDLQRLHLRDTGLEALPVELYMHPALEDIDLRDNRIADMSPILAHSHRRLAGLSLHDNPVPEPTQTALRSTLGEAGATALPLRRHGPGGQESLERWLADSSPEERVIRSEHWTALTDEPGSDDLMRFLNDLGRSNDYDFQGIDLRRRIWALIEVCVENSQVREAVFQQAAGPRTCADQMLLMLSLFEVRALVATRTAGLAAADMAPALVRIGRELYRLDEVDRVAAQHIARERASNPYGLIDEVEIHLAYRAGLVRPLGLPAQSRYMYHRVFSDVNDVRLREAARSILLAESNARIADSLLQRTFWIDFLRTSYAGEYETLNQPYHVRLEGLLQGQEGMTEQQILEAVGTLADERSEAERQLTLSLTLRLLLEHPWEGELA
ncbi:NEL-type E3 ubiquitin ligase domain-containing protein [Pseudomonas parafulva]|uniref:NEL-type E3 ubiquitin ligase domain-containing protein n=1 Tax=Pseudomonas parafulva TaxID=157782 RepID=UPI000734EF7F|nr:NEL-type E3 ubiquitin ligase domain-containing protein [Pseudomonas parafulva]